MALRFEAGFLQKLEHLRVVSRKAFAGHGRADRLARTRGQGQQFADHRPYVAGDDIRRIDWKAYKRLNRLVLRLFDEERDLPIYIFVDASRSMAEPSMFDHARRIAGALCYVGLSNLDHITILPFADRLLPDIDAGRGRARIFSVLDRLEHITAIGGTDMRAAFAQFASRSRLKGVAVVISDFLDPAGYEAGLRLLWSLGHEVYVVHLTMGGDDFPLALGDIRVVDAETGEVRDVDVTPALAHAYARARRAHAADLESFCGQLRLSYVHADTGEPFEEIILQTFRDGGFLA